MSGGGVGLSESDQGPDVWAGVQLNPPPLPPVPPAALPLTSPDSSGAFSYPLICSDGKWVYCMCGSQGFVLLNGKLEGLQCGQYLQLTRDDRVRRRARWQSEPSAGLTV